LIILTGTRRFNSGGAATSNLKLQIPLITKEFPEIANVHHGTINLELDRALVVAIPDHRTGLIDWHEAHSPGEVFDLLRIRLEAPEGAAAVQAWIYIAHHSDHRKNPRMHEIIGPYCQLSGAARCKIHIERGLVLDYRQNPIAVAL
jgi:hypothetical protein